MATVKNKVFLVMLFLSSICFSQSQKEMDSLERVIVEYETPDENYVRLRASFMTKNLFLSSKDSRWLEYSLETLKIAKDLNYKEGEVLAYGNIGVVYNHLLSNPYKAIDYYLEAIKITDENPELAPYKLTLLTNIGLLYYQQQEYYKALKRFIKSIKMLKESEGRIQPHIANRLFATLYLNVGDVYGKLNKADSSSYYYGKSIVLSKKIENHTLHATALSNLGLVLCMENSNTKAEKLINESLDLVDKHKLEYIKANVYLNAARVYLEASNLVMAEKYANLVLNLDGGSIDIEAQENLWETLTDILVAKKNFPEALTSYKKFITLRDSITSNDRKLQISRKEIQFEADKKQLLAQGEIKRQKLIKNTALFGGGFLLLSFMIWGFLYKRKRETQFDLKVADTELKALRVQMNPHFIFSSLNSINNFVQNRNVEVASNFLTKFAKLMRKTLENSEKEDITLDEELDLLKIYMEIEKRRVEAGFNYSIKIDNTINPKEVLVPPMMLQPLVENSIKHGVSQMKGLGKIEIVIKEVNNMLLCIVEDNGVGRSKAKATNKKGINGISMSTKILNNRLEIINARNKTKASFNLLDKVSGTRAELLLPLLKGF